METTKIDFLTRLFDQIESQVQFGDSKASLLIAGDAILLAVCGGLISMVSGCNSNEFTVGCMVPSVSLGLASIAAMLLMLSLVFALLAARPAAIHNDPPAELFLLSHIARLSRDDFAKMYAHTSVDDLVQETLSSIHGKARYATKKFRLLKRAVNATLLSLGFMIGTLVVAVGGRVFL